MKLNNYKILNHVWSEVKSKNERMYTFNQIFKMSILEYKLFMWSGE